MLNLCGLGRLIGRLPVVIRNDDSKRARRRQKFYGCDGEILESRALLSAAAVHAVVAHPATPSVQPTADNNNSFATAITAGNFPLGTSRTFTGNVNSANDLSDYYKVTVPTAGRFRVYLGGLSADADVQLLNSSGTPLASGTLGGTSAELLATDVSAGTYYIRVYKSGAGSTDYSLNIQVNTSNDGTLSGAFDFGSTDIASQNTWNDSVNSSTDVNDYFKFEVSRSNHVLVSLSGMTGDADLQLLNANGSVLGTSLNSGTTTDSLEFMMTAGTYYIRAYKIVSGTASYHLTLTIGDDTFATANGFGTNATSKTYNSDVGAGDAADYYKFAITTARGISVSLSGLSADADLYVYNSAGTLVGRSSNGGTASELVRLNLTAGTYYVKIASYNNVRTNYSVTNTATTGNWTTQIGNV